MTGEIALLGLLAPAIDANRRVRRRPRHRAASFSRHPQRR
jgi:hypothetical protein